ncbi:hypothetical protein ACQPZP_08130 [Spirillospora sp. CA-142024]|uniref:hypothetical protein n=1 Tax=Spirillospora sp. CA-142024 TaxID=3240036 RepID=UPI003D8C6956
MSTAVSGREKETRMARLVDRLLARMAPKATASAGCSNYYYCSKGLRYQRQCCLNEGCHTWVVGACGSP